MKKILVIEAKIFISVDEPEEGVIVPIKVDGDACGCLVQTPTGMYFSADKGSFEEADHYVRDVVLDQIPFNTSVEDVFWEE